MFPQSIALGTTVMRFQDFGPFVARVQWWQGAQCCIETAPSRSRTAVDISAVFDNCIAPLRHRHE